MIRVLQGSPGHREDKIHTQQPLQEVAWQSGHLQVFQRQDAWLRILVLPFTGCVIWASWLTDQCLSFPICKMGEILTPTSWDCCLTTTT